MSDAPRAYLHIRLHAFPSFKEDQRAGADRRVTGHVGEHAVRHLVVRGGTMPLFSRIRRLIIDGWQSPRQNCRLGILSGAAVVRVNIV